MPVEVAEASDLNAVRRLLQFGRYVYANIADEDIPDVVARGLTMLGGGKLHPWGVLMVDPEPMPTKRPDAPERAQVRAIALRHGPWTADGVKDLAAGLAQCAPDRHLPMLAMVYATEPWLQRSLAQAGFTLEDTVVYYRLSLTDDMASAQETEAALRHPGSDANPFSLRPASPADIPALAEMDARAFDYMWHYPPRDLMELLVRGRLQIAEREVDGRHLLVGYSGLLLNDGMEAHLARLAVHPDSQSIGVGRTLLRDAIGAARAEDYRTFALNTQASNERSQALYRSAGFVATGLRLPVYTLLVTARA